jgi:hypothetical protein
MAFADNNIIPIQLDYRFVTTRKIWQYDYGQILSITGQNLPTATEVHFSLDIRGGSTLSRVGTTIDGVTTVKIPDELLKNNGKSGDFSIYAFIYVTDEESGNTEYRITIPVYSRPKPENPSVDPAPEPNIFHETVTAVNNAADRAEKAAKDTEQIRDNLNLDLSEKITRPQSAKVGQVIAVKEVGTDGKPTDFEAKDMTGGASTEEIKEAVGAYMQEHPFEETDPTVPDWAKQPEKPTYTAEDVGALPDNTKIPTKTSELENDSGFLYSPPTPEVGKILKIKSVNEDGTFVCEWADGGSNLDVRINGESIVQDGVAEIPISSHDTLGLVYTDNSAGGYTTGLMNQQGRLKVNTASIDDVNKRRLRKEIDCSNFDYAVKAAMCDGKGAAWTAEEQAAARDRMGAWTTIADITLAEDVNLIDGVSVQGYRKYSVVVLLSQIIATDCYIQPRIVCGNSKTAMAYESAKNMTFLLFDIEELGYIGGENSSSLFGCGSYKNGIGAISPNAFKYSTVKANYNSTGKFPFLMGIGVVANGANIPSGSRIIIRGYS